MSVRNVLAIIFVAAGVATVLYFVFELTKPSSGEKKAFRAIFGVVFLVFLAGAYVYRGEITDFFQKGPSLSGGSGPSSAEDRQPPPSNKGQDSSVHSPKSPGGTEITSVGPISPQAWQTVAIEGTHFGTSPPFNACVDFIRITDITTNRTFPSLGPWGGCNNPILVTSWTDSEIVIEGFPAYQRGQHVFSTGDKIKVEVRNPQQNWAPMVWYSLTTTDETSLKSVPRSDARFRSPKTEAGTEITSVGPISPEAWQTILIKGTNLGTNAPFNGCVDFIRITDITTNRTFPSLGPWGGCNNPIVITSWNDTEIVITGLAAYQHGQPAFAVGHTLKIEVRNPQQNWAPMAWYSLRVED